MVIAAPLAERFDRGVCVPGDAIRVMIVSGRLDRRPGFTEESLRQLVLRHQATLAVAGVFLEGGFDVVVEDVIIGSMLREVLTMIPVPEFHLIFLDPDAAAVHEREAERGALAYGPGRFSLDGLQGILRNETDRIGRWIDTTGQSAAETVDAILADLDASRIRLPVQFTGPPPWRETSEPAPA
jgi:hypothetical protein